MNEETIFHLAREKSPDERPAFLDTACAGDAALRHRLEMLLRADEAAGSFLSQPALEAVASESATSAADTATLAPGRSSILNSLCVSYTLPRIIFPRTILWWLSV